MRKRVAGERWPKSSPTKKAYSPAKKRLLIVVEVHVLVVCKHIVAQKLV